MFCLFPNFFFNYTTPTEIYNLSLHDALPIFGQGQIQQNQSGLAPRPAVQRPGAPVGGRRSEEHTSELQSQSNLVCRLLREKKKKNLCLNQYNNSFIM